VVEGCEGRWRLKVEVLCPGRRQRLGRVAECGEAQSSLQQSRAEVVVGVGVCGSGGAVDGVNGAGCDSWRFCVGMRV
jgi:hypothetical protein